MRRDRGRVFADLWDAEALYAQEPDLAARLARLQTINRTQTVPP